VADRRHPGDLAHRQAAAVGGADRLVALGPQALAGRLPLGLALGVVLGEGGELLTGLGGFASGAGDRPIVGLILANRLA
jgi:hypothetical protein